MARAAAVAVVAVGLALGLAWALGGGLFYGLVAVAFGVQWLAFVPAYTLRTERFYDLVGSLTYVLLVTTAVLASPEVSLRGGLLAGATLVWAVRLGLFLAVRVHRAGKDGRFDELKHSAPRFFVAWTLQGLWTFLTPLAVWVVLADAQHGLGVLDVLGLGTWLVGFVLEASADAQKSRFRADPAHADTFIRDGWWAWSRHPNYAGEIALWCGVALVAASQLHGAQWLALLSPTFVFVLLRYGSGVPLLEARADAKWGGEPDYEEYKAHTPLLWPRPPR
ncbi:MAG: DUF1295 domain-containing protein [Deltaproteobacteria bacterium]|nr:MAG: DUF1295 domain-containing protein [Deltaproteobacteria bacterium]